MSGLDRLTSALAAGNNYTILSCQSEWYDSNQCPENYYCGLPGIPVTFKCDTANTCQHIFPCVHTFNCTATNTCNYLHGCGKDGPGFTCVAPGLLAIISVRHPASA